MSVLAPPKPPVHEDPEALIEEARRRARRRRLAFVAAGVVGLAIVGMVLAIVFSRMNGTGAAVPEGFHLVRARGPVQHALVELSPSRRESIDLATGKARPATSTWEVWWDRASGLDRVVARVDGRVQADLVGQACPGKRFCIPPPPFGYRQGGIKWPLSPKGATIVGSGTFRGHQVIWIEPRVAAGGSNVVERYGLDARTHEVLVYRESVGRRLFIEQVYTWLKELPASSVRFVVPKGGAPELSFPPSPDPSTQSRPSSLSAASRVLGRTPLWLGASFRGHKLRGVEVGTEGMFTRGYSGTVLRKAPFVTFDYGNLALQEFGSTRPFWYEQGPRPGQIAYDGRVVLARDGLLVLATPKGVVTPKELGPDSRALALAVARFLRPVSAEGK
jgi:hypothetical protein